MTRLISCLTLLALSGAAQAGSVTVDFDSTAPTYFGLSSYQEDGFTLSSNVPDGTLIDGNDIVRANLGVFSGGTSSQSMFFGGNGQISTITLTNDAGLAFDLLAIDTSSVLNPSGVVTVTGYLSGGGSVQQVLNVNGNLSTYNLAGLTGLSSAEISYDSAAYFAPFDLDNISLSVIPIPAAVWLFVSGLGYLVSRSVLFRKAV